MLKINIRGIETTIKGLEEASRLKIGKVEVSLEKIVSTIEKDAKELCPVDTGELKASIKSEVIKTKDGFTGKIDADTDYAAAVEARTPFIFPALEKQLSKLGDMFKL